MSAQFTATILQILEESRAALSQVHNDAIDGFLQTLRDIPRLFVTGEGRSGLVMRMFAMRLTHLGKNVYIVGDATTPSIQPGDLLVVCSGSGETTIPCLRAERARQLGASVVALCGSSNSRLAKMAHLTILLSPPAGDQSQQKRTVQFGGSRFEQTALLFCDVLTHLALERWGVDVKEMQERHANLE